MPQEFTKLQLLGFGDLHKLGITYSRAHLWRLMRAGQFPKPVALGSARYSRKAWRLKDIERFIASRETVDYAQQEPAA